MGEIVKVVKWFYVDLHISNIRAESSLDSSTKLAGKVPTVTKDKVGRALKEVERQEAEGDDGIIMATTNKQQNKRQHSHLFMFRVL